MNFHLQTISGEIILKLHPMAKISIKYKKSKANPNCKLFYKTFYLLSHDMNDKLKASLDLDGTDINR